MQYVASILSNTFIKCICRSISCALGKWSLHSRWNFTSTFTELHVHGDERWPTEVTSNTYFRGVYPNRYFENGTVLKNYAHCFAILMRLRQLCLHPVLCARAVQSLETAENILRGEYCASTHSEIHLYIRRQLAEGGRLKPWPNGTPNSSQLEPSYKIKTCIGGWPNGTAKSSQLARKPFNCLTTTAQSPNNNKTTWLEFARVGRGGQTVEYLARVGRKFELDQIQANLSQLKPSGWPNDTQLHRSCELGPSWLELGVTFGQGLKHKNVWSPKTNFQSHGRLPCCNFRPCSV